MAAAHAPSPQSTARLPSPGERAQRHQGQTRGPGRRANAPSLRAPVLSATRVLPAANQPSGSYAEKGCSPPPGGAQPDKAGTDRGRASELNAFRRTPPRLSANPRIMSVGLPTGSKLGQPTVRDNRAQPSACGGRCGPPGSSKLI
jgi:hypothetical protein